MEEEKNLSQGTSLDCNYICFFDWDPEVKNPFLCLQRNLSVFDEIPEKWVTMTMKDSGRMQRRKMGCLGNKAHSVFAKFERGMSGESRVASIARYNKLFQDLLDSNTIDESYEKLVKKIPYRVIATNDEEGNPPRSSGISNPPVEADCVTGTDYNTDDEYETNPAHELLKSKFRQTQAAANELKVEIPFMWRELSFSVAPDLPTFTKEDLHEQLINAVGRIKEKTEIDKRFLARNCVKNPVCVAKKKTMLASPASKTPAQSPTKASSPPKNTHFVEPADEFDNSTQDRPDSVSILARTVDRNDKDNSPPPSNLPSDPPSHLPSDLPSDPPVEKTNLDIQLDNCNRRIDNANEEINTLYTQQDDIDDVNEQTLYEEIARQTKKKEELLVQKENDRKDRAPPEERETQLEPVKIDDRSLSAPPLDNGLREEEHITNTLTGGLRSVYEASKTRLFSISSTCMNVLTNFKDLLQKIRRNIKTTNSNVIINNTEILIVKKELAEVKAMNKDMLNEMKLLTLHIKMDKTEMREYFPVKEQADLERFLEKNEDFCNRKRDFESLLYTVITSEDITQRQFQDVLQTTIFTREYLKNFRWPAQNPSRNQHPIIPYEFVHVLKESLSRMVGKELVDKKFINLDFWRAWTKKLSAIQRYEENREIAERNKKMDGINVLAPPPRKVIKAMKRTIPAAAMVTEKKRKVSDPNLGKKKGGLDSSAGSSKLGKSNEEIFHDQLRICGVSRYMLRYKGANALLQNALKHLGYLPCTDNAVVKAYAKKTSDKIKSKMAEFITNEESSDDEEGDEQMQQPIEEEKTNEKKKLSRNKWKRRAEEKRLLTEMGKKQHDEEKDFFDNSSDDECEADE